VDESTAIAIVGYAARLPRCLTADSAWAFICAGGVSGRLSPLDGRPAGGEAHGQNGTFVPLVNALDGCESFDARFFHFTEREAELMDPQRRLLLECVYHALEDAGEIPGEKSTGAFLSTGESEYFLLNIAAHPELFDKYGGMHLATLNGQDFAATQIAYKLDLHGPVVNVNTACSSSLVAVHYAANALLAHECDLAIAGGCSLAIAMRDGYPYKAGGIYSRSGKCRPFDLLADGTVPGSGAAAVILKRLEDAIKDGDAVRALIVGTAVNNDGHRKVGFTAPSVEGQVDVIREALTVSGLEAHDVDFVETHGTGTALGDAVEFAALRSVFCAGGRRERPLLLGSIKGNFGHAGAAAGAASLIKATRSLELNLMPPMAGYEQPNPHIDLAAANFVVPRQAIALRDNEGGCSAGVSSFGIGGTNAHVVIRQAPRRTRSAASPRPCIALASARDRAALEDSCSLYADAIGRMSQREDVADFCYTAAVGRRAFEYRHAAVGTTAGELSESIRSPHRQSRPARDEMGLGFLFDGERDDWASVARDLSACEPTFRRHLDESRLTLARLDPARYGSSLLTNDRAAAANLEASLPEPLRVAVMVALTELFRSWGLRPSCCLARGCGELVAAYAAGSLDLDTVLELAHERSAPAARTASGGAGDAVDPHARESARAKFRATTITWVSAATGQVLPVGSVPDLSLSASRSTGSVSWRAAFDAVAGLGPCRLLEVSGASAPDEISQRYDLGTNVHLIAPLRHDSGAARVYSLLAAYWADGGDVDWPAFFEFESRRKAVLPLYPFRRERRWIERPPRGRAVARHPENSSASKILDWFYAPKWDAFDVERAASVSPPNVCLVVDDGSSIATRYVQSSPGNTEKVISVLHGEEWSVEERVIHADLRTREHRVRLAAHLRTIGAPVATCLYFFDPARGEAGAAVSMLSFVRECISDIQERAPITLAAVYETAAGTPSSTPPAVAAVDGMMRVIPKELSGVRTRVIAVGERVGVRELLDVSNGDDAFRSVFVGRRSWVLGYEKLQLPRMKPEAAFKEGGRYVFFGGTGAVGRILTKAVAAENRIHFVLVGRSWVDETVQAEVHDIRAAAANAAVQAMWEVPSVRPESSPADQRQILEGRRLLTELSVAVILRYVESCGIEVGSRRRYDLRDFEAAVCKKPVLGRIARAMLRTLESTGRIRVTENIVDCGVASTGVRAEDEILRDIADRCPDFEGLGRRLKKCSQAFADVFLAGRPGVDVLYPGGSASFLEDTAPGASATTSVNACTRALVEIVRKAAARRPARPLRILEIGAGHGSLTRPLLAQLTGLRLQYCVTDVNKQVLGEARRLATANGWDWLSARFFDISKDPLEQGFAYGEFDLVLGFNVIHIAPRLAQCLSRLGILLGRDGGLVFIESVGWRPHEELVWGMTPDWWRFEDEDRRTLSPLLDGPGWEGALRDAGFRSVERWTPDEESDVELFVATLPDATLVRSAHAMSSVHARRTEQLKQLVGDGSTVEYLRADLGDEQDRAAVIERLIADPRPIDGIVYAATSGSHSLGLLHELTDVAVIGEIGLKGEAMRRIATIAHEKKPSFVVAMSSMSSVLGGIGHAAYASANAVQEAICVGQGERSETRWLAVSWDAWGMSERSFGASVKENQLEEEDAVACLLTALESGRSGHLLVSKKPLSARLEKWLSQSERRSASVSASKNAPEPDRIEREIASLWKELLGAQRELGPDDDFFSLGGDSLLAVQMVHTLRTQYGRAPEIDELLRAPKVRDVAERVRSMQNAWSPLVNLRGGTESPFLYCMHPGGGSIDCYRGLAELLEGQTPIYGLQSRRFAPADLPPHRSIEAMVSDYVEAIVATHRGAPVALVGYCFGGMIAFEAALQLRRRRVVVEQVVLIDSHPPGADDGFLDQRDFVEAQLAGRSLVNTLDWLDDLAGRDPEEQAALVCERMDWSRMRMLSAESVRRTVLDVILCNDAKNRYRPSDALDAPVHLMRIDDEDFHRDRNRLPDLGWQKFLAGAISVEFMSGKHLELFSDHRIRDVAMRLNQVLSCGSAAGPALPTSSTASASERA
jgi:acyl transferase domain-containing protein/thioesterase domain-containing protein/SAM-dependent methyltransferase/acyl carrier protein